MTGVKFFTCSVIGLDKTEKEINKFCKEHKVISVQVQEVSQLIIVMVVYRDL